MRKSCFIRSSACTSRRSSRAPGWAWASSSAWSGAIWAASGPKAAPDGARRSRSRSSRRRSDMEPYILFVEDDPDDVELTFMGLGHAGFEYRLELLHDGQQALEWLEAAAKDGRPLPAAIMLDIKMPRM